MKYIIYCLSIVFVLQLACTKDITISQPDYVAKVSIQGIIEPDSFPIVFLNRTTPFLSPAISTANEVIRNATVKVIGNNQTDILTLDSLYDRIRCQYNYFYKGKIKSILNADYQLIIENKAVVYNATTSTKISAVSLDSVGYTKAFKDVYGEHEGVIVYFKDFVGEKNYYRYEQLRPVDTTMRHASIKLSFSNSCLGKDTTTILEQGRSIYNDLNTDGLQVKLIIEPAFSHRKGLKTLVRVQTVDKNTYDFYDQLDRQKLAQSNPFVEPVFLINGQFGDKAIGFFGSRVRSKSIAFVFPE